MKRVGLDLGGTYIKGGIVDEENRIIVHGSTPTMTEREPEEIIRDMASLVKKLTEEAGVTLHDIAGIGIGSPGTIDAGSGKVLYSNNIRWENIPLAELLGKMLAEDADCDVIKVRVSNDANCSALGELVCDTDSGIQSAVLLTLGTGVGSGIILKGKLYEGEHPGGAELGHMVICHGGRQCSCGRKGCLEAYVSASALVEDVRQAARDTENSLLCVLAGEEPALRGLNGKHVIEAVRKKDPAAVKVFEQYLEYLGCGIVNIINIFRPEVIYLGGGICEGFDLMEETLQKYVKKNCFGGEIAMVAQIKKAAHGNDAGIIGAAALIDME
ncbi:MAG: ROK family protein [Lachnospiraceae bacterium]|nr:ROK family protein [Lachnospiraceae bacterium]